MTRAADAKQERGARHDNKGMLLCRLTLELSGGEAVRLE
jgi:hypothetical protein